MLLPDWPFLHATLDWLSQGLWGLTWWQIVLYTLVTTHITIASVTIFLHRHQAHRAMDLHPIPSHFFRFWLWLSTAMVTKEWVAVHRKHHAKCETMDDPHSPQAHGLKTVFWKGAELYRAEADRQETLAKFGHGTPADWLERHVYSRYPILGVSLMLVLNVAWPIVPEQVARWLPGRNFTPLGTDGMGRSDTREALRRFFEVDAEHIVLAALSALADEGTVQSTLPGQARQRYGLQDEGEPWLR